jgi:energy-coupling factor transport system permease protein
VTYERRASPLHAARATVAAAWSLVVVCAVLAFLHPVVLGALLVVVAGAAVAAQVPRRIVWILRFAVPFALLIAVINVLVVREGLTVIFRVGEVPPFGQVDLTLEALVYGAILGLRAVLIICAGALLTATVDPDEILRVFRRISFRSALTAALAVRLVPVLQRDGRRLAEARRLRADEPSRVAVLRAVASGALDRAADVAATLEVRGYRTAPVTGRRRTPRTPWSRHDRHFALSALAMTALTVLAHVLGLADVTAYPSLDVPLGTGEALLAAALVVVALLPFADRRGIEP